MKKGIVKKIALYSLSVLAFLILVLAVHIYIVTRPKAPTAYTRAMARIDIKQPINAEDGSKITAWLYQQKGIDHVLVNPKTDIVIFSYFPIQTNADRIVTAFKATFPFPAQRYVPTEAEMQSGCPVASTSMTYKLYNYFKTHF